jgi:hypothetical protein
MLTDFQNVKCFITCTIYSLLKLVHLKEVYVPIFFLENTQENVNDDYLEEKHKSLDEDGKYYFSLLLL